MEYVRDILKRETGDLERISLGNWVTITELGQMFGEGSRKTRSILRQIGFLVIEGAGRTTRHRIARWVTDKGWGKRLSPKGRQPFDVVGPEGQLWVGDRWAEAKREVEDLSDLATAAKRHLSAFKIQRPDVAASPQVQVQWLCDHYPGLSQTEKAKVVEVSQQLVSQYERGRAKRIRALMALRHSFGGPIGFPITRQLGVSGHITEAYNSSRNSSSNPTTTPPPAPELGERNASD